MCVRGEKVRESERERGREGARERGREGERDPPCTHTPTPDIMVLKVYERPACVPKNSPKIPKSKSLHPNLRKSFPRIPIRAFGKEFTFLILTFKGNSNLHKEIWDFCANEVFDFELFL